MKLKKVLAVMLSFMMLVYTASDIAYAADSDLQDQNTEVTVNTDEEITEVDEGEIIPLLSSEEPLDGDSDEMRFIADLAVEAYDHISNLKMGEGGFKVIDNNLNPTDSSGSRPGKNIFIGIKDISAEAFKDYKGQMITGLLIYKPHKAMTKDTLKNITWQGKTYKPVIKWYDEFNGDLNQEAGGEYLYLYYTNDGVMDGDPVLYSIRVWHNLDKKENYVSDMDNPEKPQDINEGVTNGGRGYMLALYHHHTPMEYDSDYHWCDCEECSYTYEKEGHDFCYKPNPGSDGTHLVYCATKRCDYEEAVPHVDKDGDGICDYCYAGSVAMINGQRFSTFEGAWEHATNMEQDATIKLCEDTYASEDGNPLYLNNGNTITIEGDGHTLKTCGSRPFNVRNGKLVIDTDIEYVGDNLDKLAYAYTKYGEIYLKSGKISVPRDKVAVGCSVLYADTGATITATDGSVEISGSGRNITGIGIRNNYMRENEDNTDTVLNLRDVKISGGTEAVSVEESKSVTISSGYYQGDYIGVMLSNGAKADISGGTVEGRNYALYILKNSTAEITGGSFRTNSTMKIVNDEANLQALLPAGYCYTNMDSGAAILLDNSSRWLDQNVRVEKHLDHSNYWENGVCRLCRYECTHDLDDNGDCRICGEHFPVTVTAADGIEKVHESFKDALNAAAELPESTVRLYADMAEENFKITGNGEVRNKVDVDLAGHRLDIAEKENSDLDKVRLENLDITFTNGELNHSSYEGASLFDGASFELIDSTVTLGEGCTFTSKAGSIGVDNSDFILKNDAKLYDKYGTINLLNNGTFKADDNAYVEVFKGIEAESGCSIRVSGNVYMECTSEVSPIKRNVPEGVVKLSGGTYKGNGGGLRSDAGLRQLLEEEYWFYDQYSPLPSEIVNGVRYENALNVKHFVHDRYFEDGVCSKCGYECKHLHISDGYCTDCRMQVEDKAKIEDVKKNIRNAKISGIVSKTYSGKKRIQSPKIVFDGKTLVKGTDYTLSYKNNLNVGKASVTIKGKGDYEGSITKTYKINPKGTYIKKLTGSKKAVKVRWNKRSLKMGKSRITGYQIQYSTSKKMTNAKKKTVKGYSKTYKKISKLKAKKRYYVRVRTYKVVSGHYYYSGWSKIKNVKTK